MIKLFTFHVVTIRKSYGNVECLANNEIEARCKIYRKYLTITNKPNNFIKIELLKVEEYRRQ